MSADLEALKAAAIAAAKVARHARIAAQEAADAYVQAREPVKIGDEVESERTGFRFLVCRVAVSCFDSLERGDDASAHFIGRRILKDRSLGEVRQLWDIEDDGKGCRVIGRYAPPEPKP